MDGLVGSACALTSALIWAFSATYMTAPAGVYGGRAANLFKSTIGAVFFLLVVLAWLGPGAFALSLPVYLGFAGSGILGLAIADTAYLNALKHIGPTLTAIVYQTSGVFTVVLGMVFLGETLSLAEGCGIALVIGGVLLAVREAARSPGHDVPLPASEGLVARATAIGPGHRGSGVLLALFAAAFHAVGLVLNKAAFDDLKAEHGTAGLRAAMLAGFVRMAAATVSLLALAVVSGSLARQTRVFREAYGWRSTFLPAFFGTFIAMITMQLSLTLLKSGVASVLISTTPIFTLPVAWWILKHRPTVRSVAGAVIALGGVGLLALEGGT